MYAVARMSNWLWIWLCLVAGLIVCAGKHLELALLDERLHTEEHEANSKTLQVENSTARAGLSIAAVPCARPCSAPDPCTLRQGPCPPSSCAAALARCLLLLAAVSCCDGTHHKRDGNHCQGCASDEASLASDLSNLHWASPGGDAAGWALGWSSCPLHWRPASMVPHSAEHELRAACMCEPLDEAHAQLRPSLFHCALLQVVSLALLG